MLPYTIAAIIFTLFSIILLFKHLGIERFNWSKFKNAIAKVFNPKMIRIAAGLIGIGLIAGIIVLSDLSSVFSEERGSRSMRGSDLWGTAIADPHGDLLKVREEAADQSLYLGSLPKGARVKASLKEEYDDNWDSWYEVECDLRGYVFGKHLKFKPGDRTWATVETQTDPLSVRQTSHQYADFVGSIPRGEKVKIHNKEKTYDTELGGFWYQVEYTLTGYAFGDELDFLAALDE